MTKITASLFANIENDANLSGIYALQGQDFTNTSKYLKQYLEQPQIKGTFPPEYADLLKDIDYLVSIEEQTKRIHYGKDFSKEVTTLATQITKDLLNLQVGERLLLPGGWLNIVGGHSMVYQVTRTEDGYEFTVFNAGAGLEYHEKKSGLEKELYNPVKTWRFPFPAEAKDKKEISLFMERLIKARLPYSPDRKKPLTENILYEEILPTISYFGGEEIASNTIADFGYTGGQLSGTCSQRCLHQMLKIMSPTLIGYEQFIFKFKHYALFDYAEACFKGLQPLTPAVAEQIHLAIENNLKILNTPNLFDEPETASYLKELKKLKEKLTTVTHPNKKSRFQAGEYAPPLTLHSSTAVHSPPRFDEPVYDTKLPNPIDFKEGKNLLDQLAQAINDIQQLKNPATQYYYLEALLLALPLKKNSPFYQEVGNLNHHKMFVKHLDDIQQLLQNLQKKWLNNAQTPAFNLMALKIIALQINPFDQPSFSSFIEAVMQTIIAHNERNPFWATNQPGFDKNFKELQERFGTAKTIPHQVFYKYLIDLLDTEPLLHKELTSLYNAKFGTDVSELHKQIRENKLEALYLISLHLNFSNSRNKEELPYRFAPIINKVKAHINLESKLRGAISPFFAQQLSDDPRLDLVLNKGTLLVYTPLYASFITWQGRTTAITKHRYELKDSPAKDALEVDIPSQSSDKGAIPPKSANGIQLKPLKTADTQSSRPVAQADIVARDYLHLRSTPSLQIPLTLDYFTRHINKLSNESDQRYVEANLFQPGLLLDALQTPSFWPQFYEYLNTGFRFFNKNGQYTRESLSFLRLNFLVSQYLYKTNKTEGLLRLKAIQEQLLKQLSQPNDPEVTYFSQQYLFLTVMTRITLGEAPGELFELALDAYFYMQGHVNPFILEDVTHSTEVSSAIAKFQLLAAQQPEHKVRQAVTNMLAKQPATQDLLIKKGNFPVYNLVNTKNGGTLEANIMLGKFFERGLARSGVPLPLQNHQLIKHLNLENRRECLISTDEEYLILPHETNEVRLFYDKTSLTVQQDWHIEGKKGEYELQALTKDHLSQHANSNLKPVTTSLPQVLTDGTMDYWQSTTDPQHGLLVRNNVPVYALRRGRFIALDEKGFSTPYQLSQYDLTWSSSLNTFESNRFIVPHASSTNTIVKLPRYNLSFEINTRTSAPVVIYQETGECVMDSASPIHPAVAGMVLANGPYTRYLVPVAQFYATEEGAEASEFYPVVHDTKGTIPTACLNAEWTNHPPVQKPLWDYQNSGKCISFRLQNGEPIADTVADALYLTYIYLATNQTEKAWKTLEDCNTRLGGLTGDPAELQFIAWICQDVPHILPGTKDDATRKTPPYVACKLKTLSLLSDYLLQDRKFDLKTPIKDDTANSQYALLQHQQLESFLTSLPQTIYSAFNRLQTMRRHLEHSYTLSTIERRRLLDYYHQSLPKGAAPRGALGYEWLNLSLEAIQQEREALLARRQSKTFSAADRKRLEFIDNHLKNLKPVVAKSTSLEQVTIDLSLSATSKINEKRLNSATQKIFEDWQNRLPGKNKFAISELHEVIMGLSSNISEDNFITNFPVYFQVAYSNPDPKLRKSLHDFCTKTLIASRHIPLDKQESHIPLLCNILYRVLENKHLLVAQYNVQDIKFDELVNRISRYNVPALKVYQAKDIYKEILATPEQILTKIRPKSMPLVTPALQKTSLLEQSDIKPHLDKFPGQQKIALAKFIASYQQLQTESTQGIAEAKTEEEAGKLLFALEEQQKKLAKQFMEEPELAGLICNLMTIAVEPGLNDKKRQLWTKALELANQGPDDPALAKKWKIERLAKARSTLTKKELLSIYCHADVAYSVEKTGLSPENAQQLHNFIHAALFHDIQGQVVNNLINSLDKAGKTGDVNMAVQALELLAKEKIPGLEEPATVIIQHEEDILLRSRQVSALKALLEGQENGEGFKETVEKIIPGGGKSKVILPVIAETKARGDNLVVIEVPPALLATNHVDLNRASQRLFGKRAYRFEFSRDSNCSPERLEQLYHQFTEIMTTRSYMVTTGESVQSLELKYLELLFAKRDETWRKQMYWLDKITGLFRHNADCIIDEVHQGLWLKKKLNYTIGESLPIGPTLIKHAIALFNFIDPEVIKQAHTLGDQFNWTPIKTELATKLINDSKSPLNQFVANAALRYGPEVRKELFAYLTNNSETLSQAIIHATTEEKGALAFFKQQLNTILPETLRQKHKVHYGKSKIKNLSPIAYTLAIPYLGNDVSNERSRFGNELEAINYTIQMMLIKGIGKKLLKERIVAWQALARQELFQNPTLKHLDETPTARGFALLEGSTGLTLSQINIADTEQMNRLHTRHKYNRALIFSMLQERSLKQINQDAAIISSDNFNHVDIYRSTQGVSGTPWNYTTYHQRLHFNPKSSFGSDAYTVELLRSKKTRISHLDYENASQFVQMALTNSKSSGRTRAIIDINATFTGVKNVEVAREIISFIKKNPHHLNRKIKHVLYFNEDQVLCALDINKPEKPIELGTSDEKEVSRLLRSTPEERFTYYDQVHTLGTDIRQYEHAHALVLTDENDSFQGWKQGNDRMRGLSQGQTVEFILPTRLTGFTYDQLVDRLKENDRKVLGLDNLFAAKAQMTNFMRRTCLSFIQDLPSEEADKKADLAQSFETFFKDIPSRDLFALYGAISKKQKLPDIFSHFKKQLLDVWTECHSKARFPLTEKELEEMGNHLQTIIDKATPDCLTEYEGLDNSLAKEVQVQKEVQKQIQVQQVALNACYNASLTPEREKSWKQHPIRSFKTNPAAVHLMTLTLNKCCAIDGVVPDLFSDKLRVSKNYAQTYQSQQQYIDVFLKPVFLVWYHLEGDILHATIVTPQEAEELALEIKLLRNSWIATTQDTVITGRQPNNILLNEHYQALREQVRFFNGEFASLLNQETPLLWLKEQPVEKIGFFENRLQLYRPGSEAELQQLKIALTQGNIEGFLYIANHPFEDLTQCKWKDLFPKTIPAQAKEYQKVAEAFVYLNKNWSITGLSLEEIQQQFDLPLSSLTYVDTHLKHLLTIKQLLIQNLSSASDEPFLFHRSKEEETCIEECLGMPLPSFYARYNIKLLGEGERLNVKESILWMIASIEALHIMQTYPALQDKTTIIDYFDDLAIITTSPDVLLSLLKTDKPSETLLLNIISNPSCDNSIMDSVLKLPDEFSEKMQLVLAKECQTREFVDKFLQRNELTERVLQVMLDNVNLEEPHLLDILKRAQNSKTLEQVSHHPAAKSQLVQNALLQHPILSTELLLSRLSKGCSNDEGLLILKHPTGVNATVLEKMAEGKFNSEILLQVMRHPMISLTAKNIAIDNPAFSPEMALEIINHSTLNADEELLKKLSSKAFELQAQSPDAWENCLIQLLKKYQGRKSIIYQAVNMIKGQPLSPRLGLEAFRALGQEALTVLPFTEMLEIASEDDLKMLIDKNKTEKLDEQQLLLLAQKCQTNDLIEKFLQRSDLTENVLNTVLAKDKLNESQLLQILKQTKRAETLKLVCNNKAASNLVRMTVFKHNALSPELLLLFLAEDRLANHDGLLVLDHPSAVTSEVLATMAAGKFTSDVLVKVINHPKVDFKTMDIVLDREEFSPNTALAIINKTDAEKDLELLKKLILKVFEQCSKVTSPEAWESTLIPVFEKYSTSRHAKEIMEIIRLQPISPNLGLQVFRLFGKDMLASLPLAAMINIAKDVDLKMLVDVSKTGKLDEELLKLLAQKCHSSELLTKFLQRDDLTENLLLDILHVQENNLKPTELLQIVNKTNNPETLKLVLLLKPTNDLVRTAVFKHPALSSELLLSFLAIGKLKNNDGLLVLEHPTAITSEVLEAMAAGKLSSGVLLGITRHVSVNSKVMNIVLDNSKFSIDIAQEIIDSKNVKDDHELLKKLTFKAFEQCGKTAFPEAWENILIQVFEKYSHHPEHSDEIVEIIKQQRLTPGVGLSVLRLFGKDLQAVLPFTEMIEIASQDDLKILVDMNKTGRLPEAELIALAEKSKTKDLIETFLQREDITDRALNAVLDGSLDYVNLRNALTHKNLSEVSRKNWLEKINAAHIADRQRFSGSTNQEFKLFLALGRLKVKAYTHALKAINDDNYADVAKTAVDLYHKLHDETEEYLKNPNAPFATNLFHENCKQAIADAKPILETHRGYKQILVDILNIILAPLKITQIRSGKWRFFVTKTDSEEVVDEISKNLEQQNPPKAS